MFSWLSWIIISCCVIYFSIYCFYIYNLSKNKSILMEMVIETKLEYEDNNESDIRRIDTLIERLNENGIKAKKRSLDKLK